MGQEEFATWEEIPLGYTDASRTAVLPHEPIRAYVEAVEETNPLFLDEEFARAQGYGGLIAPATATMHYGGPQPKPAPGQRKYRGGGVHAKQYFEFRRPVLIGETLTSTRRVVDKFVKRERKYIVQETVVTDQNGEIVCISRGTTIRSV